MSWAHPNVCRPWHFSRKFVASVHKGIACLLFIDGKEKCRKERYGRKRREKRDRYDERKEKNSVEGSFTAGNVVLKRNDSFCGRGGYGICAGSVCNDLVACATGCCNRAGADHERSI